MAIANEREQIDYIMDSFDFNKVHKAMQLLDWKWVNDSAAFSVPAEYELRTTARSLLRMVATRYKNEPYFASTGGFKASCHSGVLSLAFELEETSAEYV